MKVISEGCRTTKVFRTDGALKRGTKLREVCKQKEAKQCNGWDLFFYYMERVYEAIAIASIPLTTGDNCEV